MPKRSSKLPPEEPDANLTAFQSVTEAPKPPKPEKNPAAVALGRLGGQKGGKARAATLSASRRREIAQNAANKRWNTAE